MTPQAVYLIDVNLPTMFSLWNSPQFVHVRDIDDEWDDSRIWDHARENNLTIITKDADFSNRILFAEPPPSVIHLRFGNLRFREFFQVMSAQWDDIISMSAKCKLVNVFTDSIQGVR